MLIQRIVARMELTDESLDQRLELFTTADDGIAALIEEISREFAKGFNDTLHTTEPSSVRAYVDAQSDDYFTPFYVEGASMALAASRLLHPVKARSAHRRLLAELPSHDYLIYAGWGWWYAVRPLGATGVKRSSAWATGSLFSTLVIDGMAFASCFLDSGPPHYDVRCPHRDEDRQRVWLQGYGRALWFVAGGRPEALARQCSRWDPDLRAELYAGLGLATAFAGLREMSSLPPAPSDGELDRRAFYQGLAFGLTARRQASPRSWQRFIERLSTPTARWVTDVTDRCLDPPPLDGDAVATYTDWQRKLRHDVPISELPA